MASWATARRRTRVTPVDVVGLASGVTAMAAGGYHTCALTAGGGVKCWGITTMASWAMARRWIRITPVDVVGLASGVAAVAAGGRHTCALTAAGGVKCWGENEYGQLGDGTTTDTHHAGGRGRAGERRAAVAAGGCHTCALTAARRGQVLGDNGYGQLGDGTTTDAVTPVDVAGLASGVPALAAG